MATASIEGEALIFDAAALFARPMIDPIVLGYDHSWSDVRKGAQLSLTVLWRSVYPNPE
ncbi:hypothetical protein G7068_09800 [Leucobacter viscericola]|uniref:Uncharacterized protein n=1 Tax=Leucobacter viscericola TaxID=2714935 RepID=A0A6G7XFR9_9MICO|nr:hypothetical protein [Leucobacter viscericola]QIK63460.1 hypothetical protein G7068_09800 [Leucobacter viscericola]